MALSRKCKLSAVCFSFVCDLYVNSTQAEYKMNSEGKFSHAYECYFGMKVDDQNKNWPPHVICATYQSNLDGWLRGDRHFMLFAIFQVWREPRNHIDDLFLCV